MVKSTRASRRSTPSKTIVPVDAKVPFTVSEPANVSVPPPTFSAPAAPTVTLPFASRAPESARDPFAISAPFTVRFEADVIDPDAIVRFLKVPVPGDRLGAAPVELDEPAPSGRSWRPRSSCPRSGGSASCPVASVPANVTLPPTSMIPVLPLTASDASLKERASRHRQRLAEPRRGEEGPGGLGEAAVHGHVAPQQNDPCATAFAIWTLASGEVDESVPLIDVVQDDRAGRREGAVHGQRARERVGAAAHVQCSRRADGHVAVRVEGSREREGSVRDQRAVHRQVRGRRDGSRRDRQVPEGARSGDRLGAAPVELDQPGRRRKVRVRGPVASAAESRQLSGRDRSRERHAAGDVDDPGVAADGRASLPERARSPSPSASGRTPPSAKKAPEVIGEAAVHREVARQQDLGARRLRDLEARAEGSCAAQVARLPTPTSLNPPVPVTVPSTVMLRFASNLNPLAMVRVAPAFTVRSRQTGLAGAGRRGAVRRAGRHDHVGACRSARRRSSFRRRPRPSSPLRSTCPGRAAGSRRRRQGG